MLYDVIKLFGAAYLIWLGIKLIRSKLQGNLEIDLHAPEVSFRQSILVEVFNPKTAIFYISFFTSIYKYDFRIFRMATIHNIRTFCKFSFCFCRYSMCLSSKLYFEKV